AFVGLVVFGAAMLLLISSVVIVEPHQQAIVTTFGRLGGEPLNAGLHLKLPWPIARVDYYDVTLVRQILIGVTERTKATGDPILWSNVHGDNEPLIVAPTPLQGASDQPASTAAQK